MNVKPTTPQRRTQAISRLWAIAALMGCAAIVYTPARAGVIAPVGLVPGDTFQLVFVTSTTTAAANTSMAYYDGFVTTLADNAGLGTYNGLAVTWQDLGSTSAVSAISREPLSDTAPIYTIAGALVALNATGLWSGTLQNPITTDETGSHPGNNSTWTGTKSNGAADSGLELGSLAIQVRFGKDNFINANWVQTGLTDNSNQLNHLYAISSIMTVSDPPTQTPEPATMTVLGVGLAGLGVARCRRRIARNPRVQQNTP